MTRTSLRVASSVSILALTIISPQVQAQTPDTSQQAAAAAGDVQNGPEIVVTAQGRAQALSDVPVAISAISAETLRNSGANDIRQLNQLAPSLLVSSTGSEANGSARIRGIGTVGDNPGLESSVPVFIDGVYRARSGIGLNELGEIARVEVQRGPQGTLGGRNSSAGLISIFSQKPSFEFGGSAEATYGNYDHFRLAGSIMGPLTEKIAARIDAVHVRRDGFHKDVANNTDVNNRNRTFVRGQLLIEPTDSLSVRLIGDYTTRNERCCAAIYVDSSANPAVGQLNAPAAQLYPLSPTGNNIINVLRDLGQPLTSLTPGFDRSIHVTPGRSFAGKTKDYGFSGQVDWDLGGISLAAITAYRVYRSGQASDTDYSAVDIINRATSDDYFRQFRTFTQELRLQGEAFEGKLDWLVGGYYANERLTLRDNQRFGAQFGRFATCRIVSGGGPLAALYRPASPSCVVPVIGPAAIAGATGTSGADIAAALSALDNLNNRGSVDERYYQHDRNFALFTHNIIHITDALDLTLGLRYTNDKKDFRASFVNDNTTCPQVQQLVLDDLSTGNATARSLAGALISLACQGNSTAELNGVSIHDKRGEDEFTGTAILSYKATPDLLFYASYSRGYKAGGFNMDRSGLKSPIMPFAAMPGGVQGLVSNLRFDPELVNSYELGAKYATGPFSASLTLFRSDFSNFQLNTFNGTSFIVQTINGCESDLNGTDRDLSASSGACPAENVGYGVRTEGLELETALVPTDNFRVTAGLTYARTRYRANLVGNKAGAPLDPALRLLPGNFMSNAPEFVVTASAAWTPQIGSDGLSALLYVDGRLTGDYNTGSDLFPQKKQDGYAIVNARIGLRGREERWSIEGWVQNLFNRQYAQVAFNAPFQAGASSAPFVDPLYPGGRQIFAQYLGEPRTYGLTLRGKF